MEQNLYLMEQKNGNKRRTILRLIRNEQYDKKEHF
jgi:hypothetical protein